MKYSRPFAVICVAVVFVTIGLVWRFSAPSSHVVCKTTKGEVEIVVKPDWSPRGAERFLQLVNDGFFTELPLFRCVGRFLCQFGSAPPRVNAKHYTPLTDDPPRPELRTFKEGYMSFAGSGPNSRATHIFIALADVPSLGTQPWETPFAYVEEKSMRKTVDLFSTTYGDTAPAGHGPEPRLIEAPGGSEYLKREFPQLDWLLSCSVKH
jgi:peptidyl-prolyl cis-trans isomerase A (cyclophilin A)